MDLAEVDRKLWARVMKDPEGCWEFTGAKVGAGYGKLYVGRVQWMAHRLSYVLALGEIPPGAIVRHSCDNPPCVRPEHLFLGTPADNGWDMKARGRAKGRVGARGHIRPRVGAKGTSYEVRVHVGDGKYETATRTTEVEAQQALTAILSDLDAGKFGTRKAKAPTGTVAQLVERWRQHSEADWAPRTRETYECYLRLHVLPTLGARRVRDVQTSDLDALYADLRRTKGLSPASVRKVHVIIRRAFSDAVRWKWIMSNPAVEARPPVVHLPDLEPPSAKEVRALLDRAAADDPDLAVFLAVAADTGARRGEVCGLRWSDIDLDAAELVISRSVAIDKGGLLVKDTKTHQARRIALGDPLVAILRLHHERAVEQAKALKMKLPVNGYVFAAPADFESPWRPDTATHRFVRVRNKAGLPKVRLHDLRHAMITDWLSSGEDVRTVMGRSGHGSLQTLTRYAHFVPARDKDAAKRLGNRHQV